METPIYVKVGFWPPSKSNKVYSGPYVSCPNEEYKIMFSGLYVIHWLGQRNGGDHCEYCLKAEKWRRENGISNKLENSMKLPPQFIVIDYNVDKTIKILKSNITTLTKMLEG